MTKEQFVLQRCAQFLAPVLCRRVANALADVLEDRPAFDSAGAEIQAAQQSSLQRVSEIFNSLPQSLRAHLEFVAELEAQNKKLRKCAEISQREAAQAKIALAEARANARTPRTYERCNHCSGMKFSAGICEWSLATMRGDLTDQPLLCCMRKDQA